MTRRDVWILGAVGLFVVALYLVGLDAGLGNGDETIYAEMVRTMQRSGRYLTLEYQGVEVLQRPPTSLVLYAFVSHIVPGETGLRLAPALLTAATYVFIGLWLLRRTGRLDAAVTAVLFGAAIPTVYLYGRLAFTDPPFVFACTVALLATIDAQKDLRWLPLAAAGLGAAFALKSMAAGVVAVALVPWLGVAAWRLRRHDRARRRGLIALGLFAVLALPYYIAGLAIHGREFWQEHIERTLFARAAGDLEHVIGIGGPGAYLRHLWEADTAPFAVIFLTTLLALVVLCWRRRLATLGIALSYSAGTLVMLSLTGTRLPHYLLVFYPGLVVAVGLLVAELGEQFAGSSSVRPLVAPVLGLALLATTLAGEPFDAAVVPDRDARALGDAAREALPEDAAVYTIDWYAPALGYYADRRWHMLVTPPELARALSHIDPFRKTGTIHELASWPRPSGAFYLAGERQRLTRLGTDFQPIEILASSGDYVLARVGSKGHSPGS